MANAFDIAVEDVEEPEEVFEEVEDPEEQPIEYDEEDPNLVAAFSVNDKGKRLLKKIAQRVKEDFDDGWEGGQTYRDRMLKNWKLFAGDLPPRLAPYQHMANAHIPTLLQNIVLVASRFEDELFGDWTSWFTVLPQGTENEDYATILSEHGQWQFSEQIIDFPRQQSRGILSFLFGDVFIHSVWDPDREINRHEVLTCDEIVIPYWHVSTMPDMSDLPWRARKFIYNRHEVQSRAGEWEGVDKLLEEERGTEDEPMNELSKGAAATMGLEEESQERGPYQIIMYEGWLEPELMDGQETDRFCQVWMDYQSERVLKLSIHEEVGWEEEYRVQRQRQELQTYIQQVESYQAMQLQLEQAGAAGMLDPMAAMAPQMLPPEPVPPNWMLDPMDFSEEPPPARKRPIHMFVHGVAIEPLTGTLGIGLGHSQADLNRAQNVLLTQFVDSATLSNSRTLITSNTVRFENGQLEIGPGKVNKANGLVGEKISDHILPLDFGQANPQMLQMIEMFSQLAEGVGQAPGILAGQPGKSGETFRGVNLRAEQAVKQLSTLARRYATNVLTPLLRNNARLNSIFMKDEELIYVTDHLLHRLRPLRVSRRMYERNYSVRFRSDMRFSSQQQQIQEADELTQMPMAIPALAQNMAFWQRAIAGSLKARNKEEYLPYLGPEMPPPQTPLGMMPPQPGPMGPGGPPPGPGAPPPNPQGPPAPPGGPPQPGVPGPGGQPEGGP